MTDILKKLVEDREMLQFRTFCEIANPSPLVLTVVKSSPLAVALFLFLSIRKVAEAFPRD